VQPLSRTATREQYFDSALEILAESGFKNLNIGVISKKFGLTSGSFYHHFGGWPPFVEGLLHYWEDRQVQILRNEHYGSGDPTTDLLLLKRLPIDLNHGAEAAIRTWGAHDDAVKTALLRVDNARRKTTLRSILPFVDDPEKARELAALSMTVLVGYQQTGGEVSGNVSLERMLDEHAALVLAYQSAN
jgi:AcrR family transcriptional regulator